IYARAAARRRPVVALVVGEAGLGKSRLMMEFARTLELRPEHPLILSARGLAQTARVPFGLWRAMWNNRLRLDEADAPGASGDQFVKGMLEMWGSSLSAIPGVEVAHVVGGLIGFDFPNSPYLAALSGYPRRARERAFELTAQLFARAGARAPLVLMFDDLHWADDGTLDLIEHLLAERGSDLPLLILGGARTGIGDRLTGWRTHEAIQTITLNPLPTNPEIVKEVFKQAETLPGSWLALLAERSGGNPYFLEELVRALIRQGAILVKPDGWRASGDGPLDVALPDTLHSLLQSRLDALPAEVKAVAQAAAVVGRVFWVGAVQAILHTAADTGLLTAPLDENGWRTMVESALETMQHNELAFQRVGSGSNGDREFIFKHHLLRDTAYEMLPKKYRRRFHAAAATWLAGHGGYPALIADHLEQAGEHTRAIMYYRQAAEDAAARGASAEAQALTERRQAVERQMQKIGTGPL
ncbi:MAG: AAA family ATPase, partial [Chloroflexi bacterium]|nr:AAA family ATPase [Chloroflexota bacterium]